jgi:ferritin-like metal-binding protein YciE
MIEKSRRAKACEGMVGLSAEADHVIEEAKKGSVPDAGIVAAAQAVEHYEIARYGALAAWAKQMGMRDAAGLLAQTLKVEEAADEKHKGVAEEINATAEDDRKAA